MVTDTTIKKRYKQTEIGVIPEEWRILALKELSTEILQGVNTAIDIPEYVEDGIPMLKANNVIDQEVEFKGCDHISLRTFQKYSERFKIKKDDFLFSNIGARLGTGSLFQHEIECSFAWNVMKIRPNKRKIKPQYLNYILNSNYVSQVIKQIQTGSGMGFVSKDAMANILFAIAPLPEQNAIATVLSDTDVLIECLEKLIAKKKAIKQGAMQQLLTGKKRLPGFSGEWEVKELGELVDYRNGKSFESHIIDNGDYFLITLNSLDITGKLKDDHLRVSFNDKSLNKNDLIMILSDVAHGNFLGLTDLIPEDNKYVLNQRVGALKNIKHLTPYYLSKYINLKQKYFKTAGQGSSQQNLSKDDILNFKVLFPSTKSEQTAISTILSDMDAEIESLEQKRDKYIMLKQGMMQQLLTGRIRIYANN